MQQSFNSSEYIKHLASELIRNFAYSSAATTPVLVGSAREKEVIRKLEMLLPKSIGVGSGCIIDSFGGTSKQMDIVIYEKDLCPVFSINESAETTYYPCEGVIAAGEVKSSLNSAELTNIFDKANSVKSLRRYSVPESGGLGRKTYLAYRSYGSRTGFQGTPEQDFDQLNKSTDQIYFFALCGTLDLLPETVVDKVLLELKKLNFINECNLISILDHGLVFYYDVSKNALRNTAREGGSVLITAKREHNFEYLLSRINIAINSNRTVPIEAFNRYLSLNHNLQLSGSIVKAINFN